MKIKSKFQIITVLSIVIGLMIAFTLFIHIQDMRAAIEEDDKVDQLTSGVFDLNLLTNDYLLNRTERTQMQWQLRYDSLTELIHNMKFRIKEEQLLQKEILHNHDRLKVIFSRIIANYASRKNSSEMPAELSELEDRLVGKLLTNSQTMVSSAGQLIEISHRRLVSAQRKSSLVVILLVILITVIIAANSFFTRKSIIVPISKLQKGTQTIGEGDLNFKIASVAKDEIGGLSRAFDHMTEKLKAITVSRDKLEDEINERKQAEEALIKSETFLNATGQIAKVGGWQIDGETKKVFWTKEIYNITEVPNDYDPSSLEKEAIIFFSAEDQIRLEKAIQRAFEHNEPYDMEFQITTAKGNKKWVQAICKPITVDGKTVKLTGTFQNITDRKQAEEKIKASLKEKEVLLSEIHHRVKNNMQVIISLLRLRADKIEDKKYADMFKEGEDRVRSMSLVHEQLYQSKDLANINFGEYVKRLANGLFASHGVDINKVRLNVEIGDILFDLENAIPCGLIINELVSNSLKHAFPYEREGEINISLRSINEDEFELTVSDDGIGISEDLDIEQTDTMGLTLAKVLAGHQLDGKIDLDRTGGTQFNIKFKRTAYKPRI